MSKFVVKEIYIDKFNSTYDKFENFENGLNIVCGDNEIGKSTMMDFIKSVFLREKIDGSGYVNCVKDDKEINLVINNKKDNELYLKEITAHTYKTGFIINLDDIISSQKKEADEWINIIKDSSGDAVNIKQSEYCDFIYGKKNPFCLTSSNNLSKSFTKQFDKLKDLDNKIKLAEAKEEEYNYYCKEIENLTKLQVNKEKEYEYLKLLSDISDISEEMKNIRINEKLTDLKSQYEEIKQSYYHLKSKKADEENIKLNIKNLDNSYKEELKKLNKIVDYDIEKIKEFNTNQDKLKEAKSIIDEKNEIKRNEEKINDNIEKIKKDIKNKQKEIDKLIQKQSKLNIENIEQYKEDKILLENYSTLFVEEYEKIKQAVSINDIEMSNNKIFLMTFVGLLLLGLGLLILVPGFLKLIALSIIFVSFGGMLNAILEKNRKMAVKKDVSVKNFDYSVQNINKLLKKYGIDAGKNEIVVKTNSLIQKMNYNITEYKEISNELIDVESDLQDFNNQLIKINEEKENINNQLKENEEKIKIFLNDLMFDDIDIYPDVHDSVKNLQGIIAEKYKNIELEKEIQELINEFLRKLTEFIENANIDINKPSNLEVNEYGKILDVIQKLTDENLKNSQLLEDKRNKIQVKNSIIEEKYADLKEKFNNKTEFDLKELEKEIKEINEKRILCTQSKSELENVEGLSDLKLKRDAELNYIRKQINNLMIKEIVLNIIKISKEKFNAIQPNLVSAKKYLSQITNQKYNEIDLENNIIKGDDTPQKEWIKLSRGTKEQLYLSLRLGYASNYSKDKDGSDNGIPQMPILIDDAFVNFDKDRTAAVLKCLEEFSKTNQVIYFTCHSKYTEDLLKSNKIKYNLIKLSN